MLAWKLESREYLGFVSHPAFEAIPALHPLKEQTHSTDCILTIRQVRKAFEDLIAGTLKRY